MEQHTKRGSSWQVVLVVAAAFAVAGLAACSDEEPGENTGNSCTAASQCYPGIDPATIQGTVICLDRVTSGYCTHTCTVDGDCCAADGECRTGFPQVCSPMESAPETYCFLSCEGVADEATYCQQNANAAFVCRSTGGGTLNRKVCLP
jgi:hypothetical protein